MFWKRLISTFLAVMIAFACIGFAEEIEIVEENAEAEEEVVAETELSTLDIALGGRVVTDEPTHITVGNSTKVNGAFFSSQFGNNTSDIDVRTMLHGYNPFVWDTQLTFALDEQVVSNLSESVNNAGDKVYTFTLHDDLMWNDGSPMTAADWVFGYVLQGSPEFEQISGDTDVWKHIVGYEEFSNGKLPYFSGIRLLDKYRFSVTVKKEYLPYFYEYSYLYIMPSPISVIAPGCEIADDGKGAYIRNIDKSIVEPIYTAELLTDTILDPVDGYLSYPMLTCGPYSLVSYDREAGIVEFTINEYYKGNYLGVKPVINDITLVPVLPQEMSEKLESGEIDLINKVVDGRIINELRGLLIEPGGFDLSNYARLGYGYFGLACEQGPQQFQKVRQAINYAFNTDQYVRDFLLGFGMNVYGFYGLGQWMTQAAIGNLRPDNLTPEQEAIWDSFTLDGLNVYAQDLDHSLQLLIEDGWVLNEKGEPFDPEVDKIRYKKLKDRIVDGEAVDGELMRLSFNFGVIEDDEAAHMALDSIREAMEPMGVEFVVNEDTFINILSDHLREEGKREYDMIFMAYNFVSIFDPLVEFASKEEYPGSQNATGLYDRELIDLCWELHYTEPGNVQEFEEKWIAFQTRFNEILPTVPIYSNVYFDFYKDWLHNYDPVENPNWPRAILYAYWSEPEVVEEEVVEEEEEEFLEDDEFIIID